MNEVSICEACGQRPVAEVIGDDDPDEPYKLCRECGERLRRRALRPLEWFNLVAKHGDKFLLHDDFYDQDGVSEVLRKVEGCSAEDMPAPTLEEASRSLERLVDYCISRWRLDVPEYNAFSGFSEDAILEELKRRAAQGNRYVTGVAFDLCANVLAFAAESWVRARYRPACDDDMLFSWAEAAARCLPQPEGLHKTIDALRAYAGKDLRERKDALLWFRSPAVLDWIEIHAPHANVTGDWGQLAALSELSWGRVEAWLSRGRPLSLIALDALTILIPRPGQAPIVKMLARPEGAPGWPGVYASIAGLHGRRHDAARKRLMPLSDRTHGRAAHRIMCAYWPVRAVIRPASAVPAPRRSSPAAQPSPHASRGRPRPLPPWRWRRRPGCRAWRRCA